jgi:hypothetical protein
MNLERIETKKRKDKSMKGEKKRRRECLEKVRREE